MHTKGPISFTEDGFIYASNGYSIGMLHARARPKAFSSKEMRANGQHLVDCWNACEVICNPVKTVPKLLDACKAASIEIAHLQSEMGEDYTRVGCYQQLQQALAEAEGRE